MRGYIIAGLAMTAAALTGLIVLERQVNPGARTPAAAPARNLVPQLAGQPDSAADPVAGNVSAILARPLFEPSRRPVAAPASAATVSGLPRVSGVLVTPAGRSVIFAGVAGGKPVIAVEGSRIGAYVVQSIGAGTVTILGPDGMRTLHPSYDPNRAPPAPAAALPFGPLPLARPPGPPPGAPAQNPDTLTLPLRTPS